MTSTLTPSSQAPTRTAGRQSAGTLLAAVAVALVTWLVSVPALGVDLVVGSGSAVRTVGPAAVALAPLLAGTLAWLLLVVLERLSRRGRRAWRIVACLLLVLSLLGPAFMARSGEVLATLVVMHVAVGATLVAGLGGLPRRRLRGVAGRARGVR